MVDTEKRKTQKKKTRSTGGRKKLTLFNKFMQSEMARLKEAEPLISHQERFKKATSNWKKTKETTAKA